MTVRTFTSTLTVDSTSEPHCRNLCVRAGIGYETLDITLSILSSYMDIDRDVNCASTWLVTEWSDYLCYITCIDLVI